MADTQVQEELEALKKDIAQLRSDLSELAGAVRSAGTERATEARSSLEEEIRRARAELRNKLNMARERGQEAVDDVEGRIGEHPLGSLAAAFGLGFVIAKLMDLGGRR